MRIFFPQTHFISAFVALLVFAMAGLGSAKAVSGTEMLSSCEAMLRGLQVLNDGRINFNQQGERCYHYMSAIQELTRLVDDENRRPIVPTLKACLPDQGTLVQLIRIFVKYAQDNPAKLTYLRR